MINMTFIKTKFTQKIAAIILPVVLFYTNRFNNSFTETKVVLELSDKNNLTL